MVDIDNDVTLKKLRETPQLQGSRNEHALKTHFAAHDRDNSGDLDLEEFQRALREFGVRLSNGEVRRVFMIFDDDRSGNIKYLLRSIHVIQILQFTPVFGSML